MKGLLSIVIIALLLFSSSCRDSDRDRDNSTESAEVFWITTNHFNTLIREVHKVAVVDSILNGIDTALAVAPEICMDSITRIPDSGPFPIDLTINYSTDNSCDGERNRSGIIQASFNGIYSDLGTVIQITTVNYEIDGYQISAEISMKVIKESIDTTLFDVQIKNGVIINNNKTGNKLTIQDGHLLYAHFNGTKTVTASDDNFVITGSGNGIADNGVIYSYESEFETVLMANCNYETFGSFVLKAPDQLDRILNFGEGGSCDNIMLVSIPPANGDITVEIP